MQTAARNAAEIVAPIEAETEVVTADVAPAAEADAEDVDVATQAAAAAAVSDGDTAEPSLKHKMEDGVPPVSEQGRKRRAFFFRSP